MHADWVKYPNYVKSTAYKDCCDYFLREREGAGGLRDQNRFQKVDWGIHTR